MKKIYLSIFSILIMIFTISCGNALNPLFYNRAKSSSGGELNKPEVEAPEAIPENEDPFKIPSEYNDPDCGGFNASVFDEWLFKASFRGDKLPVYSFLTQDSRYWIPGGIDWNGITANYYKPNDGENEASGYGIKGMSVYKYDAANPLYDNNGYLPGRMDRFRFYSIQGKAVVVDLKQYLIAVDTYSKFIFAFGKITKTDTVMSDKVPIAFEAIEYHGNYDFYEYDPIGYVEDDGSVVLYEHYQKEFVKNPTSYNPSIHPEFTSVAKHSPDSPGNSPYFVLDTSAINPEDILDKLKNSMYGIRDKLVLYEYKFDATGNSLELTSNHYYDGSLGRETYTFSKVVGLTAVEYTNSSGKTITITGLDDFAKINDGTRTYILNYSDDGPEFKYRVAGKVYKAKDGSYEYRFNPDGTSLDYYKNGKYSKSYTFSQQDASDRAVYREGFLTYWGLRVDDYNNIKDGVLYWSGTSWGGNEAPTDNISSTPGYLNVNIVEGGFTENVKGKTYKHRDYSEYDISSPLPEDYKPTGKSLILYTYTFSADGQTLDIKEETWNSTMVTKQYKVVSVQDKSAVYEYNGSQITVSIQTDNNTLYKDNIVVGTTSFTDYGPIFTDRVRGAKFTGTGNSSIRNIVYQFNTAGTEFTLTYEEKGLFTGWSSKSFTYTLARYDNDHNNHHRGVYECAEATTVFKYGWVELSNNDKTIKTSKSYGAIGTPGSGSALDYEGTRQ